MSNGTQTDLGSISQSLMELVAKAADGVIAVKVGIHRSASGVSLGDGLIAVSSYALRKEGEIPVQAGNGNTGVAKVLGRDPGIDLAILKTEDLALSSQPDCDAASLKPGMLAAVIGMTTDVGPSTSLGIVGAVGPSRRMWRGGSLGQFIRLDVNLYPSQFGAAVVDIGGKLIGLATPALSRHATIAVPVSDLRRVAGELAAQGRIRHGYLGVGMQGVVIQASVASKLTIEATAGLLLMSVEPGSAADKAGLQIGDILLELGGKRTSDLEELYGLLRGDAVGRHLEATILRGGEIRTFGITVAERGSRGR